MYERVKDQRAWQLEQGRELSVLKEKIDATQEIGVSNRVLDGQTAMGLAGLDRCVELLEKQGRFLLDQQEQESNVWHNVAFNLREEVLEGEGKIMRLQGLLDIQRKSSQQLCLSFNEARREMIAALKVARKERAKRQAMKKELDKLKGEFAKLKGMVHLTVASLNLQNHGTPTEDIQDVFNPQIVEESSDEEEVPQENAVAIPVPGPLLEILHTLQEIPPSPGTSLCQFLLEPIVIASSIPPLGSSPQLLRLLIEDLTVGVGATVEEFEEAVTHEAELEVMVESLVGSGDKVLTNDPDAVGNFLRLGTWLWILLLWKETSWIDTMGEGLCRHNSCQSVFAFCNRSYCLVVLVSCDL